MPFIDRFTVGLGTKTRKPARVYVHEAGFRDAFRPDKGLDSPRVYVRNLLYLQKFGDDFLIVALWGDEGQKIAEIFGYEGIDPWPGNPEVHSWVYKDGLYQHENRYQPKSNTIACEDTMIVLGEEAKVRRRSPNLEDYMKNPPKLGDLLRKS